MGAKKRQTMGKIMRERERAEKRARKQEKKDEKKAAREAEAAGIAFPGTVEETDEPDDSERSAVNGAPPGTSVG